jgi:hypothetical protein
MCEVGGANARSFAAQVKHWLEQLNSNSFSAPPRLTSGQVQLRIAARPRMRSHSPICR